MSSLPPSVPGSWKWVHFHCCFLTKDSLPTEARLIFLYSFCEIGDFTDKGSLQVFFTSWTTGVKSMMIPLWHTWKQTTHAILKANFPSFKWPLDIDFSVKSWWWWWEVAKQKQRRGKGQILVQISGTSKSVSSAGFTEESSSSSLKKIADSFA